METTWKYLQNQFLTATADNYKKAMKMSNYHDTILKTTMDNNPSDPDYATLYNRYNPLHIEMDVAYNQWKNAGGQQEGQTLNVNQLLKLLIGKVDKWDRKVQDAFEKNTPEYKAIFPNGRAPFNSGEKDERIEALETLGIALTPHATLATVKTEVDTFYLQLEQARDAQLSAKGLNKGLADVVNLKRINAMEMQYANLGFLINKFYTTPELIEIFFELEQLRESPQVFFTGTLDPAETEPVLVHTFIADDQLRLKANGAGPIAFYLATTSGGINSTAVTVAANEETTIPASAFGITNYGAHRYLTAVNQSGVETHYEVTLL
jgi:hypothetical protein